MQTAMSDLFERILLLKNSQTFSEVKTEDLKAVAQSLEEEQYFAGDRVFDMGEYGDCMYILQKGRIGIALESGKPRPDQEYIAVLTEGECFGEMNLLDDMPRSASAHVLEDSTLLTLEKSRLRGLIINFPELSLGIMKGLSTRLRKANTTKRDNKS
jgi:CRP/FNR family cyclic AMP-dependent transcriptional regulator